MSKSPRSEEDLLAKVARGLLELDDLPAFRTSMLAQLRGLVDCDHSSYNEIALAGGEAFVATDPIDTRVSPERMQQFPQLVLQNPLAAHYLRTGDTRTLRLSDFIARSKLHALELYDVIYKNVGTEYQLAFTIPSEGQLIGITFNNKASDFGERDLTLLDSVRQMVMLTYRNLHDRARLDAVMGALNTEIQGPVAIFTVEASGLFTACHERAERLLCKLAGEHSQLDALYAWAREQRCTRLSDCTTPLQIECGQGTIEARYLHGPPGALDAVTIHPLETQSPYTLCTLGLTHRQAEVLQLVLQGATNAEIAMCLCISAHTVRHHLEDIYRRLGVNTRAAAAHLASQAFAGRVTLPV